MEMSKTKAIGFLAALVVLIAIAAVVFPHARATLLLEVGPAVLFGGVTVTYQFPVPGVAAQTPAAAAAAGFHNGYNTVRGTVIATLDADTDAVISHGFGLSATALAAGQPEVSFYGLTGQAAAVRLSLWTAAITDLNTVTLTKATTGGSGAATAQLAFFVRRPHSIAI